MTNLDPSATMLAGPVCLNPSMLPIVPEANTVPSMDNADLPSCGSANTISHTCGCQFINPTNREVATKLTPSYVIRQNTKRFSEGVFVTLINVSSPGFYHPES